MCGIFGVFNARKAAEWVVIGLHGNQHRAIDYAGVVSSDGSHLYRHAGAGLARQVFSDARVLDRLHGRHAIGHIRYPTVEDDPTRENFQPILGNYGGEPFALAHNGNLTNRSELEQLIGGTMATSMDTECIVRLLEKFHTGDLIEDLKRVFSHLRGSYALCILMRERLVAALDPSSNRPLALGRKDESWFISSETCGFGGAGAEFVRDIAPSEILSIEAPEGPRSWPFADARWKKCRFEGNYFSHPSSRAFGEAVDEYRIRLGRALEERFPVPGADIVASVPDSSNFIAMGYAESGRSGAYRPVIIRSHYVGRTFIAASQAKRDAEVAQKFTFTAHAIEGRRVVVVDDSVVRGTTLPKIVGELRRYGAKEVHVRIGSPPILFPCRYGINTPRQEELVSANVTKTHICEAVGADSLEFLPLEAQKQLSPQPQTFCYACMDGQYWDHAAAD